jgi:pseudouridine kinase
LVGGAVLDITSSPRDKLVSMTSNPGPVKLSFGGVARNVAEVLKKLQVDAFLVSAVGNDDFGNLLKNHLKEEKFDLQGIITGSNRTAVYNCIMDEKGEMISAIADMDILEEISPQHVERVLKLKMISNGKRTIFLDGNVSIGVFQTVARLAKESNYNIFFDPTSVPKSVKPIDAKCLGDLTFIKPNEDELFAMAKRVKKNVKSMDDCMELLLRQGVKHVLLTRGDKGVVYATLVNNKMKKQFFNTFPLPPNSTRNVTGCGDNFCGGFLFGITNDYSIEKSIVLGMRAAHLTLQLPYAVHPDLSVNSIL